ncbi:MAG TPA: FG-GAP-like repeat-containing protein, partial [Pyrinomonadaceae bacterium]
MKKHGILRTIYFLLVLAASSAVCEAQTCVPSTMAAGSLDSCFGTNGKMSAQVSVKRDTANAVVVQPDGKIVVAGVVNVDSGGSTLGADFGVVRFNSNGSLDAAFDGDGKVTTNFGNTRFDAAKAIALQADGKIIVAGVSGTGGFNTDFALARYNADGSLDTTFDGDGLVLTDIGAGTADTAYAVTIQTDGKIVVAGDSRVNGSNSSGAAARYNADGSLDTTFDLDGIVTVGGVSTFYAVALQPDGKIVGAGTNQKLVVARINSNGAIDTSFGVNGYANYSALNFSDTAYAVLVEADGKIVAGGSSTTSASASPTCAPMVRFTAAGSIETSSFNCNESPGSLAIKALALQKDGKIVAAGFGGLHPYLGFVILRYNHALSLDYSFNNGEGSIHIGFDGTNFQAQASASGVALQTDNKIVAAGWNVNNGLETSWPFYVVRVNAGIVAPHLAGRLFDFEGDGKADVSVFRPSTNVWYEFQSSNAQVTAQSFGLSGDIAAPADFDGDGKMDLGIFRPTSGDWWYKSSISGVFNNIHWGASGDVPRPSDFDGDGKADFIVFRPSNSTWYRFGSTGQVSITPFGQTGDKPVTGDFDDDGKSDAAIFRPSTGDWWWQSSNDNIQRATHWGISTDVPAPGDYDGDGKTDFAVYRPSNGTWYIYNSATLSSTIVNFGIAEDKPVAADYDG